MKILLLQDDFPPQSFGGAGIVAYQLAKSLLALGHDVLVITAVGVKGDAGRGEYDGLAVHRVYSRYPERWRAYLSVYNRAVVQEVARVIKEFSPDVVHAHNIHTHLSYHSLKISKKSGAKVFLTAHDAMLFHYGKLVEHINPSNISIPDTFNYRISPWQQMKNYRMRYNPFRNVLIRYFLRYVDTMFAVSNALREALNQNGISNVVTIHNGIDVTQWEITPEAIEACKKKNNVSGKKVLLFGGRLSAAKGGEQALLILKEVIAVIPNTVLLIMGTKNQYAEYILKKAEQLDIGTHVVFTGWISGQDLKATYALSDVVLVPSLYLDPFPTINLEAMASKKPIVGTCFGGTPEVIEDTKTGYVVNPYHVENTARRIIDLLTNASLSSDMGNAGYQRVKNTFSIDSQVKKVISWYSVEEGL